ncbi:MAG TPA: DUF1990 domain-containing protein [Mycobacteriales bacterium]|nr:DUF1990 domain-containing protein [Mycobacteriales bacterium]
MADRALGYDCVGATRPADDGFDAPAGYARYERSVRIGHGDEDFERAADAVLAWEVKTRTGFAVMGAEPHEGQRLWITGHVGPLTIAEPAVVVAVLRTADRAALAYGTLDGHPVSGEEAFLVRRDTDGTVWFTLRSLSRRARGAWAPAYPGVLLAQRVFRRRYLRALA